MSGPILVIDDDPYTRRILCKFLASHGYLVETASDDVSGLRSLTTHKPALVLLDVYLSEAHAHQVVEHLRQCAVPPPVIVISSDPDGDTWAATIGAHTFLAKPLNLEELLRCVQALRVQPT